MICQGCSIWEENERLRAENTQLKERIAQLEVQNGKLKRQLALYQNIKQYSRR
jgi:regulator of replication initiation timing